MAPAIDLLFLLPCFQNDVERFEPVQWNRQLVRPEINHPAVAARNVAGVFTTFVEGALGGPS